MTTSHIAVKRNSADEQSFLFSFHSSERPAQTPQVVDQSSFSSSSHLGAQSFYVVLGLNTRLLKL